jgi:hypothetical protein
MKEPAFRWAAWWLLLIQGSITGIVSSSYFTLPTGPDRYKKIDKTESPSFGPHGWVGDRSESATHAEKLDGRELGPWRHEPAAKATHPRNVGDVM